MFLLTTKVSFSYIKHFSDYTLFFLPTTMNSLLIHSLHLSHILLLHLLISSVNSPSVESFSLNCAPISS